MTTEDDFQAALDAHPEDYQTRLVFADWLEEHGDPRAEGYRALGALRLYAYAGGVFFAFADYATATLDSRDLRDRSQLPKDWFGALVKVVGRKATVHAGGSWLDFDCARGAEDAAALAFAQLPAERRAELLAS